MAYPVHLKTLILYALNAKVDRVPWVNGKLLFPWEIKIKIKVFYSLVK
tara:strand:- start:1127 stop:1270 length:144 start_codon:yes stop_codon:yes gene_type:complete